MSAYDISVNIDKENDVVYIMRKDADKATTINVSITADILVRFDPHTKEAVGFTIEDFSSVFPELKSAREYHLMEFFDRQLEIINTSKEAMSKI